MRTLPVIILTLGTVETYVLGFILKTMPIMQWLAFAASITMAAIAIVKLAISGYKKVVKFKNQLLKR